MKLLHHPKLLHVLHSGQLFCSERMASATLPGLRDDFDRLLLASPGSAVLEVKVLACLSLLLHTCPQAPFGLAILEAIRTLCDRFGAAQRIDDYRRLLLGAPSDALA